MGMRADIQAGRFTDRAEFDGLDREVQEAGDTLAMHAYWCYGQSIEVAIQSAGHFLRSVVAPQLKGADVQARAEAREFLAGLREEVLADRGRQAQAEEGLSGPVADLDLPF